ncbi:MAG TPA: zinc-dependent metalloprotease, partial [Phycisphaerales bacterium]|nr:zinc-dependent metalloprotease [Phycisphaerales bacterium]
MSRTTRFVTALSALGLALLVPVQLVAAIDENAQSQQGSQDQPTGTTEAPAWPHTMPPGAAPGAPGQEPEEFAKWDDVSKDFTKVVSTADGEASLYTIYTRAKDNQMLAELPRNFEQQKLMFAYTISAGIPTSGVQVGDMYVYWKRYDKQLALIQPNLGVRTTGDLESTRGHDRVFTDRVVLTIPILTMGPGGGPVIDLDNLLVAQAGQFFGYTVQGANASLATIEKAKAFPNNVVVGFELPLNGGQLGTISYSIEMIPENTGYQPRLADHRVGYFTTTFMDLGNPGDDTPWHRYINRWKLEKADPSLKLSPPKEPIVFYLENTIPVRYRRWVRDGVLEWNKAFEKVGISNAIEVYQQDARTGAHMDKDPEDARYNFVLWTTADMGFAIGPSRVDPRTGQIIDADIVMDEGFISAYASTWKKLIPQMALDAFGPDTYAWLGDHPEWDPRVLLATPSERPEVLHQLQYQHAMRSMTNPSGHPALGADPTLLGDDPFDGLTGRVSQSDGGCMQAMAKSLDMALIRLNPQLILDLTAAQAKPGDPAKDPADAPSTLDGMPEDFIGPLIKDVIMHESGHTLGLRHNFKASSIHSLKEMNSPEFKGQAETASVMDYNPVNINFGDGPVQGDWCMTTIGPYDYWAIDYGYGSGDPKAVAAKSAEADLPYATDEDTWGPDPLSKRFDYGSNSLDYSDSTMRLVKDLRGKILDKLVKDGDSWGKAREAYEVLLGRQFGAVAIASDWIGGSSVNRDRKGEPNARDPVTPISVEQQRRALKFIIDNMFRDDAFGLTPALLSKMTVENWWDQGGMGTV